jgi:hypothetical protein
VAVRGEEARSLLQRLLDAVADDLPTDVTVRITGEGRRCCLEAWRKPQVHKGVAVPAGEVTIVAAPFGLGPWVPFLPRKTAARLTAADALELVQDVVSTASGWPWPSITAAVHAEADDRGVRVWLEDSAGRIVPSAGPVSLDAM